MIDFYGAQGPEELLTHTWEEEPQIISHTRIFVCSVCGAYVHRTTWGFARNIETIDFYIRYEQIVGQVPIDCDTAVMMMALE